MMDKEAVTKIQEAVGIFQAAETLKQAHLTAPLVALPEDFRMHDLESYLAGRVRYRGAMNTRSIRDYIAYARDHARAGSVCFVEAEEMAATTFFNLGNEDDPGHGDFRATLSLQITAELKALLTLNGSHTAQKDMAEFAEDYFDEVTFYSRAGDALPSSTAIAAIRRITIEATRTQDSEENSFSAKRSAMEEIEAKSALGLPAGFRFECVPFHGLAPRSFDLRLSVLTGGDKPVLVARIRRLEAAQQAMSEEFHELLEAAFDGTDIETYIGRFRD